MAMLKNINNVDLTTFGGRLYVDIYEKFESVSNFCKKNNLQLRSLQRYVSNERVPNLDVLLDFSKLGLDIDFLIKGVREKEVEYSLDDKSSLVKEPESDYGLLDGIVQVDFYKGVASAGHGAFAEDRIKQIPFPKYIIKGIRKPAMVKASGDSMCPIIEDGDLLVFEQVHACRNGNTIICTYGNEVFVKKYISTPKHLLLRSINKDFKDIDIDQEKLIIHGVVKKIIKSL